MKRYWKTVFIIIVVVDSIIFTFAYYVAGGGLLASWRSIGKPGEEVVRIVAIAIYEFPGGFLYRPGETYVYVESASGNYYECCGFNGQGSWTQVQKIRSSEYAFKNCGLIEPDFIIPFHQVIDYRGLKWCGEMGSGQIIYALDEDGIIRVRKTFFSHIRFSWFLVIMTAVTILIVILCSGLRAILHAGRILKIRGNSKN